MSYRPIDSRPPHAPGLNDENAVTSPRASRGMRATTPPTGPIKPGQAPQLYQQKLPFGAAAKAAEKTGQSESRTATRASATPSPSFSTGFSSQSDSARTVDALRQELAEAHALADILKSQLAVTIDERDRLHMALFEEQDIAREWQQLAADAIAENDALRAALGEAGMDADAVVAAAEQAREAAVADADGDAESRRAGAVDSAPVTEVGATRREEPSRSVQGDASLSGMGEDSEGEEQVP
ncbi:hypothetical protein AMAG_00305 [Allomyces macrogynus ATCC 38327]|uniref:Uncharacterized protein n=1 Tax=Allomyces macrogynus (strain ATCC 38327) TaxID=578462 RepID=A0A0L0RW65_ALLM3|nr:hypothetical protein AMAG_00305 [Allomyces macrogynus ATCC 38327]|eukprot:KNE54326.1 hypothetical protein AMAG_00305 [Allomyces macrogynus ATCC 38327]